MKKCYKCGPTPQPLENFANDRSQRGGKDQLCKVHRRLVQAKFRAAHRESERARIGDYRARVKAATLPLPPLTVAPHAVVQLGDARYRIVQIAPAAVRLSNGAWVDRTRLEARDVLQR